MPKVIALVVPTLNGGEGWAKCLAAIQRQSLQPDVKLVIDSGSIDNTVEAAKSHGFTVQQIRKDEFDHGGTRQMAVERLVDTDIIVFMTQDAILAAHDSLDILVAALSRDGIAAAYGRQLPHAGAKLIESHMRLFNYPDTSATRSAEDIPALGIRAAFCSNSFAAYRRKALLGLGGFPNRQIMIEDAIVAGKAILAGWKLAYVAEAAVFHSHSYTTLDEFRRYFDIGVAHARSKDLFSQLGNVRGEGLRFVRSEIRYLLRHNKLLVPLSLLRAAVKLLGYNLGCNERRIPASVKRYLSMHTDFWNAESGCDQYNAH